MFFPRFNISEVEPAAVQQQLSTCFAEWGLPGSIKVDNGKPFGDPQRSSVPELALWLIALGVRVIWNRPRSPRDNAKVERMQGTSRAYCSQCFEMSRVECCLSQVIFVRKVNNSGTFNFYAQCVYLGYPHRGKTISVHYDAASKQFMITEPGGSIIACLAADNFSSQNIEALSVCQNRYVKCANFMSEQIAKT